MNALEFVCVLESAKRSWSRFSTHACPAVPVIVLVVVVIPFEGGTIAGKKAEIHCGDHIAAKTPTATRMHHTPYRERVLGGSPLSPTETIMKPNNPSSVIK